jgi:hypothetical protein
MIRHIRSPPIPNKNPLCRPKKIDAQKPITEQAKQKSEKSKNIFKGL